MLNPIKIYNEILGFLFVTYCGLMTDPNLTLRKKGYTNYYYLLAECKQGLLYILDLFIPQERKKFMQTLEHIKKFGLQEDSIVVLILNTKITLNTVLNITKQDLDLDAKATQVRLYVQGAARRDMRRLGDRHQTNQLSKYLGQMQMFLNPTEQNEYWKEFTQHFMQVELNEPC